MYERICTLTDYAMQYVVESSNRVVKNLRAAAAFVPASRGMGQHTVGLGGEEHIAKLANQ
eukprot:1444887-Pleurochrysis_carterae.AAC.2